MRNGRLDLDIDVSADLTSYRMAFTAAYEIGPTSADAVSFVFPGVDDVAALSVTLDGYPITVWKTEPALHATRSSFRLGARANAPGPHVLHVEGPILRHAEPYFAHWGGWHPFLGDRNEPVPIGLTVTTHGGLGAVASGRRLLDRPFEDGRVSRWETRNPQGWIFLAVGSFTERSVTTGDVPLQLWLPSDAPPLDPIAMSEESSAVLSFFEAHLGRAEVDTVRWVLLPHREVANFSIDGTIVGARDSGERAAASPEFVRGFLAHELAHYWFGDLVQGNGEGARWLAEGFAEYWRYRYEDDRTGDAIPWAFRNQAVVGAFSDREPPTLMENVPGADEVYYQKGAAVLYALERLLGRDALDVAMRQYVAAFRGRSVVPADFFDAVEETVGRDLGWFEEQWLQRSRGPVLSINAVEVAKDAGRYRVTARIGQVAPAYRLHLPVEILTEGGGAQEREVVVDAVTHEFSFSLAARPTRINLDPRGEVFKWFSQEDMPLSFAQFRNGLQAGGRYFVDSPAVTSGVDWSSVASWITSQFGDSLRVLQPEHADHLILLGPAATRLRSKVLDDARPAESGTMRALVCRLPGRPGVKVVAIDGTPPVADVPPIIPEAPLTGVTFLGPNMVGGVVASLPTIGADVPRR